MDEAHHLSQLIVEEEPTDETASTSFRRRESSLPVSINAVPRLYRRSMAYSASQDNPSVITIARAPSAQQGNGKNMTNRRTASSLLDESNFGATAAHWNSHSAASSPTASSIQEPLLAEAHQVNHNNSAEPNKPELRGRINLAMNISLAANILLLVAKIYAFWVSKSKAILASAADSLVDIASQLVIAYAEYKVHKADPRFPVGRTRLETVGVVSCAVIMTLSTIEVVQQAGCDLWQGFHGSLPTIDMGVMMYTILGAATGIKVLLWVYCVALRNTSDSMMALAEDHRNDILSNLTAILCGFVASLSVKYWWVDPVGAILISAYIIYSWGLICMNQVDKIVGKGAPEDFIGTLQKLANSHHDQLEVDVVRAYFFGSRFLVEMEVVLPAEMSVKESHDIALVLQHKVEGFDEVERAFVHVDYAKREEPEHKVERNLLNNSSNIFESHDSLQSRHSSTGSPHPTLEKASS